MGRAIGSQPITNIGFDSISPNEGGTDHSSRTLPSYSLGIWPQPHRGHRRRPRRWQWSLAGRVCSRARHGRQGRRRERARMICGDTFFLARHFYGLESRNNNFMTILRRQATKRQRQNVTSLARFGNETGAPATSLSPLHLIAMLVIRLH